MRTIFFLFFILWTNTNYALDVPFFYGKVIDEAGILSDETKILLQEKLTEHEKQTSNQVVVLTIPSLEGEILEEYSLKVASTWKLGQKTKDNGVLLLIAKTDRKLRIEVGYGLEQSLTDSICNQIIRNDITPLFKKNDYSGGVQKGIDSILNAIEGSYKSEPNSEINITNPLGNAEIPLLFSILFGAVFFTVITPFTIMTAVTPYLGWFLYFFLIPFYATFPLAIFGNRGILFLPLYVIGMFILKIYFGFTKKGKQIAEKYAQKFNTGSGRSSSRSGSFSGSSSSGSFSGGGGGSFGGGGSSGSW